MVSAMLLLTGNEYKLALAVRERFGFKAQSVVTSILAKEISSWADLHPNEIELIKRLAKAHNVELCVS